MKWRWMGLVAAMFLTGEAGAQMEALEQQYQSLCNPPAPMNAGFCVMMRQQLDELRQSTTQSSSRYADDPDRYEDDPEFVARQAQRQRQCEADCVTNNSGPGLGRDAIAICQSVCPTSGGSARSRPATADAPRARPPVPVPAPAASQSYFGVIPSDRGKPEEQQYWRAYCERRNHPSGSPAAKSCSDILDRVMAQAPHQITQPARQPTPSQANAGSGSYFSTLPANRGTPEQHQYWKANCENRNHAAGSLGDANCKSIFGRVMSQAPRPSATPTPTATPAPTITGSPTAQPKTPQRQAGQNAPQYSGGGMPLDPAGNACISLTLRSTSTSKYSIDRSFALSNRASCGPVKVVIESARSDIPGVYRTTDTIGPGQSRTLSCLYNREKGFGCTQPEVSFP